MDYDAKRKELQDKIYKIVSSDEGYWYKQTEEIRELEGEILSLDKQQRVEEIREDPEGTLKVLVDLEIQVQDLQQSVDDFKAYFKKMSELQR